MEYRSHNVDAGRRLYRQAADLARTAGNREMLARLFLFWLIEELAAAANVDLSILEQAGQASIKPKDKVQSLLARRVDALAESRGLK